jgi:hypothetical protein
MRSGPGGFACCDRCASLPGRSRAGATSGSAAGEAGVPAATATVARRRLLKAAVFPKQADPAARGRGATGHPGGYAGDHPGRRPQSEAGHLAPVYGQTIGGGFPDVSQLPRTVVGTVLDVSPHVLVLGDAGREQRFTITADAVAWRGTQLEPSALRQDDRAVVRLHPSGRNVADRIWANIGRVTGIITERSGNQLLVDEGATRGSQVISLQHRAVGRIQVRFPSLEPGYLVDIIGLRRADELVGMIPATSQPAYPVHRMPPPARVSGHVTDFISSRLTDSISGSATWHEPRDEPPAILGVTYPALDPDTGCAEELAGASRQGYSRMPYLAIGSVLRVTNDCVGADCLVPVTGCATIARLFNDRCVTCGTSPRGRIADLTMASFIALGGELERGCFNATITIGE